MGNGKCPIETECCSFYGYCGTSAVHCDNLAVANAAPSTTTAVSASGEIGGGGAPSIYGSCGGGEVGNGICPNNNECCSMYGL